jgi:hypothetical protein
MLKPSVAAALLAVAHRKAESTALDHLPGIDQPEPVLV